jgi:hypothetical protein
MPYFPFSLGYMLSVYIALDFIWGGEANEHLNQGHEDAAKLR